MVACGSAPQAEGLAERRREAWHFSVLMEEPSIEPEEAALCGKATYFHLRVLCHERRVNCEKYMGCKEYRWRISRRFSDFQELDADLRANQVLPASVVMPRKTFWRHHFPTTEFATSRAQELHRYINEALDAAKAHATAHPEPLGDAVEYKALAQFLGLEQQASKLSHTWALPPDAEQRHAALVYSFDKGVYVWGHHRPTDAASRFTRFDRKAVLGDLSVTYAEAKGGTRRRARSDGAPAGAAGGGRSTPRRSWPCSPQLSASLPQPLPELGTCPLSALSSPGQSHAASPAASPPESRCHTPSRRLSQPVVEEGDECCWSLSSVSTADTEPPPLRPEEPQVGGAAWLELDLDAERLREEEHARWWAGLEWRRHAAAGEGAEGEEARDAGPATDDSPAGNSHEASPRPCATAEARLRTVAEFERAAALHRELSALHEDLNWILGYGVEGKTLVVVQQAMPLSCGLRSTPFTPQRCHRVLGQALKALGHLHDQLLPHGHLSPESFLIEEGALGPQVRLAWTPGQRRPEGHVSATLGFRAPGPPNVAGDVWALACVVLVWWAGFQPVPHPWTQFARSRRLQHDIHEALAEQPPERPKALLDLHSAAATAEEPGHSFLALLASLLTRCLAWDPAERPSVGQLLQHAFFEQAL